VLLRGRGGGLLRGGREGKVEETEREKERAAGG